MKAVAAVLAQAALLVFAAKSGAVEAAGGLDFNRQVKPILSEACFRCHGFDESARKSGLRLDTREGATSPAKSGALAVVPGDIQRSELVARISAADPDDLMPPPESGKTLTPEQIGILKRWVEQGAAYAKHWSFLAPRAEALPKTKQSGWQRNEIDAFVLARIEAEGFKPAGEAAREVLLRRVTLDLTGLPPSLEELDAFLEDRRPDAYARVVDRLLASPRLGEHLAADWLDTARYADTNGYFGDKTREAWPWREWVIRALNGNMPFDRFTIEQLAGDLMPGATLEQRIATGFHRNSMANNESGIIDEEYRVETIVDRLDATAMTWMGLTLGCAQCHDHKFDPISQREYYQLFAFFNNTPEKGLVREESPPPTIEVPSSAQKRQLTELTGRKARAERDFEPHAEKLKQEMAAWEKGAAGEFVSADPAQSAFHCGFDEPGQSSSYREAGGGNLSYDAGILGASAKFDGTKHIEAMGEFGLDAHKPWTLALWVKGEGSLGCVFSKIEPVGERRGVEMIWQKGRLQINLVNRWGASAIEAVTDEPLRYRAWHHVALAYDGSGKAAGLSLFINGETARIHFNRDNLSGSIGNHEPLRLGRRDSGLGFYGELDELHILPRIVSQPEATAWFWSERVRGIIARKPAQRDKDDRALLEEYYVAHHAAREMADAYHAMASARSAEADFRELIPTTMIMAEMPQSRATHVLTRGLYDQPGQEVSAAVPSVLPELPTDAERNRLGLARWLVSPSNPLTARVTVNRYWRLCFGDGLVRTAGDFGARGELPTHPELLDWLSVRFMQSGWDVKAMLRLIVTSAAYRQSSIPTVRLLEVDPENRLLARGPRFRLTAEALRDQALEVSGLLVEKLGGPSVKPFQPPGLWEAVSYNGEETYTVDQGEGLRRRTLYTFWKRQAPPPGILTFDGPTREKCIICRARTNTPLQALQLLNDETYVKAARALAARLLEDKTAGVDEGARMRLLFRTVTSREPGKDELPLLLSLLQSQKAGFVANPVAAKELLAAGDLPHGASLNPVELASWTVVAQAILNLDEVITRR